MVSNSTTQAIIAALGYFDIFDYPLTKKEIEKFVAPSITSADLERSVKSKKISRKGEYFFLSGREKIVKMRLEKEKISEKKLQKAYSSLRWIRYISTILYVGISGSLAMKNAKNTDDIDIFIITKPHTLWLTRLLVDSLLLFTGKLRRFARSTTEDTICTNMWMDVAHLEFGMKRQNIYTAHEIVQLLPLYNRGKTYEEFISQNAWIEQFFPHLSVAFRLTKPTYRTWLLVPLEFFAEKMQLYYMKKHRTTETIAKGFVAFHPKDYTNHILEKWKERQKKWHIQ